MKTLILLCVGAVSLTGCSRDYPDRHVAKCQLEWYSASDRVQEAWVSPYDFLKECMSAEDFEFVAPSGSPCAAYGPPGPQFPQCYVSRSNFNYQVKRLFH